LAEQTNEMKIIHSVLMMTDGTQFN